MLDGERMTHTKIPHLAGFMVTDNSRAKAQLKYQLRLLEVQFKALITSSRGKSHGTELSSLCEQLALGYMDYLKLINESDISITELAHNQSPNQEPEQYHLILNTQQQLANSIAREEKARFVMQLATLYYHFKRIDADFSPIQDTNDFSLIKKLNYFLQQNVIDKWLFALVDFWNHYEATIPNLANLFSHVSVSVKQTAMHFFSNDQLVSLINAIFFYKLYPDKLFSELIHPEKLVSIRTRLGLIHHFIELIQQHLYYFAHPDELKSEIDYLFHGEDLPQGINIAVQDDCREIIQNAVKLVHVKSTPENEHKVTLERLHDLARAYKFWFNPNRLIDAVMVLQQRLVKPSSVPNEMTFQQEMIVLYQQLTTNECLDLYGYFTNNDTRYLIYTLYSIIKGHPLEWLPSLNEVEKRTIEYVFDALKVVMESLRLELKNRQINTEPYIYDLEKNHVHPGKRNRDAVFRILVIYGGDIKLSHNNLDELFQFLESSG